MQRLAALVPRPRLHPIRFHEVLASNAKLPALVVPQGPKVKKQATEAAAAAGREIKPAQARPGRIRCARLFKRVFDSAAARCAAAVSTSTNADVAGARFDQVGRGTVEDLPQRA